MRIEFDEQLIRLHNSIIDMGNMCREVIELATNALVKYTNDDNKHEIDESVRKIVEVDCEIDKSERYIESLCFKLLLTQHPVARDLRRVSAALKMISDMERIGDQASDIGEIIKYIPSGKITHKIHINEMSRIAVKMVCDSVKAYVTSDVELARKVIEDDDELDDMFCRVKNEIIEELSHSGSDGEECIDLLMIAKYLERIGDHATNIAEWSEYAVCGTHKSSEIKDI